MSSSPLGPTFGSVSFESADLGSSFRTIVDVNSQDTVANADVQVDSLELSVSSTTTWTLDPRPLAKQNTEIKK